MTCGLDGEAALALCTRSLLSLAMDATSRKRRCEARQSPAKRVRRLITQQLATRCVEPQMAAQMGHFVLSGSPKRKKYTPKRRLQYQQPSIAHGKSSIFSSDVQYFNLYYLQIQSCLIMLRQPFQAFILHCPLKQWSIVRESGESFKGKHKCIWSLTYKPLYIIHGW